MFNVCRLLRYLVIFYKRNVKCDGLGNSMDKLYEEMH